MRNGGCLPKVSVKEWDQQKRGYGLAIKRYSSL